ncbi:MAG TPA: ATP-binding protein, partial [Phycisphaeraceae bacterium]
GLSHAEPVDMEHVVRKAADLLRPAAERKQQNIAIEISSQLPPVKGNADYLERAVTNLLDNAVKYTPEGGRIAVSVSVRGARLIVEVTDNGIGIPAADLSRIFERFYRVDRSRSREMGGTGLGLSIVKHIAQAHGGGIEVTSTPGEGSTFRLHLPLPDPRNR